MWWVRFSTSPAGDVLACGNGCGKVGSEGEHGLHASVQEAYACASDPGTSRRGPSTDTWSAPPPLQVCLWDPSSCTSGRPQAVLAHKSCRSTVRS